MVLKAATYPEKKTGLQTYLIKKGIKP